MGEHAQGMSHDEDERWVEQMPARDLAKAVRNPKQHKDELIQASFGEFGYVDPILLDERTGRIVSGHGRVANVLKLERDGGEPPDGVTVDDLGRWCVPVDRGWRSENDQDAEAYLVLANRGPELARYVDTELTDALLAIEAEDPDLLPLTGLDAARVDDLLGHGDEDNPLDDTDPELEEEPYREQYGLLIPCATDDEAEMIALVLSEQHPEFLDGAAYKARAIRA